MRPAAHLEAAIEILATLEGGSRGTDRVLHDDLARRRYAGAGDRRAIAGFVYSCLRRRAVTRWAFAAAGAAVTPRLEAFAGWMAKAGTGLQGLNDLIAAGGAHAPAPLSADETSSLAVAGTPAPDRSPPDWVRAGVPAWTMPLFVRRFGTDAEAEARALNEPAALDLRVNPLRAKTESPEQARSAAMARLAEDGIAGNPTPFAPLGLRVAAPRGLARTKAYGEGLVEIQDEGSQLVAACVAALPGETVIDYCAGAGGKTLALAASMGNRGHLIACDADGPRLERLKTRAARAGAVVETRTLAGPRSVHDLGAAADWVLVDAPCSGSGAWRRDPAARWRLTPDGLAALTALQDRILREAARLVRPGGMLVYATCSLFMEENEDRIQSFSQDTPQFAVVPCAVLGAVPGAVLAGEGPFLRTTPLRHGCDGFFAATLRAAS